MTEAKTTTMNDNTDTLRNVELRRLNSNDFKITDSNGQEFLVEPLHMPEVATLLSEIKEWSPSDDTLFGRNIFSLTEDLAAVEPNRDEPGIAWVTTDTGINPDSATTYNIKSKTHLRELKAVIEFYLDNRTPHEKVVSIGMSSESFRNLYSFLREQYRERDDFEYTESCTRILRRHEETIGTNLYSEEQEVVEDAIETFDLPEFPSDIVQSVKKIHESMNDPAVHLPEVEA